MRDDIKNRLTCAARQFRHNSDNSPDIHKPREGFVFGYDREEVDELIGDLLGELEAARAQQSGEGREPAIPFVLGNVYQTASGEWVRFVEVHNEGTSYETMEDESGVNRYTNRSGDMGRVTARPVDCSGNVPPLYTHPAKAQGVPESFGDIESAVDMLEDYASALANGNLDGAGHSSYQDIHAIADNLKGLVTAPPSDNPELDCCCGETEEAWRLCPQHGPAAPDMGGEK